MNRLGFLRFGFAALTAATLSSYAQAPSGQNGFEQQRRAPEMQRDATVAIPLKPVHRSQYTALYQMFSFQFPTWAPNSLHWDEPSNLNIQSDGSWYIYARRLANFRRTGGVLDTGNIYTALANVTFYDGPIVNNQCSGSVVHSRDFVLGSLDYKREVYDIANRGTDPQIAANESKIRCASVTRWWR